MMQSSRLGAAAHRIIASSLTTQTRGVILRSLSSSIGRTADPDAIHGGPNERSKLVEQERGPEVKGGVENYQPTSKPAPFASSPKIESSGVKTPLDPTMQQKRHYGVQERRAVLGDVSCVGVDGYPKGSSSSSSTGDDQKRQEEDKEYFKHHKASPLSEVELADTRKPVTQATDGSATNSSGVITFKGEQLESAEETMMRAMRVWKEVAMKGDPDMPHSRALRDALRARGEYYDFEWELPTDV